jgi:hypothetical protein
MRYLVYLLLAANVVYFGWSLFQGPETVAERHALPPLPDGARRLITLQERDSGQAPELDAARLDTLTATQPPGAVASPVCKALGPFTVRAELEAVAGRLSDIGLEPAQRTTKSREKNGFWVYLPTMERDQSREVVQQLKDRNDDDYYVGKDYFIALGTFRDIDRAELRLAEVRQYGLDAILEPRNDTREVYWLELPDGGVAAAELAAIRAENPGLELHTLSCL